MTPDLERVAVEQARDAEVAAASLAYERDDDRDAFRRCLNRVYEMGRLAAQSVHPDPQRVREARPAKRALQLADALRASGGRLRADYGWHHPADIMEEAANLLAATPPAPQPVGGEVEPLIEAADYLTGLYRNLWLGKGPVRDLAEAEGAYNAAKRAALAHTTDDAREA